jgi:hypothetical protein
MYDKEVVFKSGSKARKTIRTDEVMENNKKEEIN